jgi:hypothetical protein
LVQGIREDPEYGFAFRVVPSQPNLHSFHDLRLG